MNLSDFLFIFILCIITSCALIIVYISCEIISYYCDCFIPLNDNHNNTLDDKVEVFIIKY